MRAAQIKLGGLEVERAEIREVGVTQGGEFIEQGGERLALALVELGFAIEGVEGPVFAMLEDDFDAGEPVGALAVDEMADDSVGAPVAGPAGGGGPGIRQAAKEAAEGGGSAGENGRAFFQELSGHGTMIGRGCR